MRRWVWLLVLLIGCGDDTKSISVNLVKMTLTPATTVLTAGKTKRLLAQLVDDQGRTYDVSGSSTWTSSDPGIVRASAGGLVAGVAAGMATVSATRENLTGNCAIMVVASEVMKIDVAPASLTLGRGQMAQLHAIATLVSGSTAEVTSNTMWSSNNLAAATVMTGLVTGVAFGQATVQAATDQVTSNGVHVTVGDVADAGVDGP
jgi:uncharacterized protein YjdB